MHGRLFLTLLFSPWTIESAPSRGNLASPLYRKRSGKCAVGDTDCGREAYPNGAGKRPPIENSPQTSRRLPVKLGGVRGAIPIGPEAFSNLCTAEAVSFTHFLLC